MNLMNLSIIIPTINEADRLPQNIKRIFDYFDKFQKKIKYEIIICDDNSKDNTINSVKKIFNNYSFKNYKIISNKNKKKFGKGYCQRLGISESKGDYLLLIDADLSVPINYISDCLKLVSEKRYSLVCGSRVDNSKNNKIYRHIIGLLNNILLHIFLYDRIVPDSTCGFKFIEAKKIKKIYKTLIIDTGFLEVEIIHKFIKENYNIYHLPVIWNNDPNSRIRVFRSIFVDFINIFKIKYS